MSIKLKSLIAASATCLACLIFSGLNGLYFSLQVFCGSFILFFMLFDSLRSSSLFHPLPFLSLILVWSMSCAPVIAYSSGYNIALPPKEIDWLSWHVFTSIIYFFCIFFLFIGVYLGKAHNLSFRNRFLKGAVQFKNITLIVLVISFLMQIYVFYKFGGLIGYMNTWSNEREQFQGLGVYLILAEAFPIIFAFYILLSRKLTNKSFFYFALIIIVFFILKLLFGGFRGSRSNTIWGLFWLAGVIHIVYYRFKITHFIAGALFLVSFMSLYSLYKTFGVDAFSGQYTLQDTGRYDGNTGLGVLLTDFSRAGEHAYLLHEYYNRDDYELKLGQTYGASLFKIIPGVSSPFGHDNKNSAGAELFYGHTISAEHSYYYNSRIYGLYGEGVLNFGPFLPVLFFIIIGYVVGVLHSICINFSATNPMIFIVPFISNLSLMLILADSDNIVFFAFKNGLVAFLFLLLISKSQRIS